MRKEDRGFRPKQRGPRPKCHFGSEFRQVGLVCPLREMGEDHISSTAVEIGREPIGKILVRKMARAGGNTLFEFPIVNGAGPQHIAAVIGFDDDRVTSLELFAD